MFWQGETTQPQTFGTSDRTLAAINHGESPICVEGFHTSQRQHFRSFTPNMLNLHLRS